MRNIICLLIFLLTIPTLVQSQAQGNSTYIGYTYKAMLPSKTLPNGVRNMGGALIGDIYADPLYEIATVEKGRTKMLWLNVSTGQNSTGVTGWKVLDVLSFSSLTKSDYLFFAGDPSINCTNDGKEVLNLVGVGRLNQRQGIFRPSKLWIANLAIKKFEPVTIAGMKCEYSEP